MLQKIQPFALLALLLGCIDPYTFVIHDPIPALVIEAHISDKSFRETLLYPSDGRYFMVRLTYTGSVTNTRPEPVNGATVELLTGDGDIFLYSPHGQGNYVLLDSMFAAKKGIQYKLRISLLDGHIYESAWEAMPDILMPVMGEVRFSETVKQMYAMEAGNWVLKTRKMVAVHIDVPENESGETIYYRWTYSPTWIYLAPLASTNSPVYRCWATDPTYLNTYSLQVDKSGKYRKDLFEVLSVRNERLFEKFSLLVTQHAMTESYYSFWREMKARNEGGSLAGIPPYNLRTNFTAVTGGKPVSGYFGVTSEQATRWYFNVNDLSYDVDNTLKAECLIQYGPDGPAPECFDCRQYSFGVATTEQPSWWLK